MTKWCWPKKIIPTVKIVNDHLVIKIPMITVWVMLIGLGTGVLLAACQHAAATM